MTNKPSNTTKSTDSRVHKVHSVKYNFIMNFILTASGFIFPLITFPYVSRVLTETGTGAVTFVTAYANYFLMAAQLGIPTYGVRACARVRDDKKRLSHTFQEIMLINLIMTIIVTVVYFITIFSIPALFENRAMYVISAATFILQFLGTNWLFQALEQYDYITMRNIIFKVIAIVLMFIFVHRIEHATIYCAITVFASVGSNVLNFFRARRYISWQKLGKYNLKRHMKPILILFAQNLAISVYTNLDTLMIGFMKTTPDVGYYGAAMRIKVILTSLVTSLGNVLLPRMSYYVKHKQASDFIKTMVKALNFALFMSIPLAIFFSVNSENILRVLAGSRYLPAVPTLIFLVITIVPIGITNVLGIQVLTPLVKEKYVMLSVIGGAVTDFVLNLIFIPTMVHTGAAIATLIAEGVVLLIQLKYTKKEINAVKKNGLHVHLIKYAIVGALSVIPCIFINFIPFPFAILNLILAVISYGVCYIGILYLTKDEMIKQVFSGVKRKLAKK